MARTAPVAPGRAGCRPWSGPRQLWRRPVDEHTWKGVQRSYYKQMQENEIKEGRQDDQAEPAGVGPGAARQRRQPRPAARARRPDVRPGARRSRHGSRPRRAGRRAGGGRAHRPRRGGGDRLLGGVVPRRPLRGCGLGDRPREPRNPARPSASRQRVCATRGWRRAAAVALGLTALGATAPAAADGGGGAGRHCVLEVAGARPAEPALDGLPLPDLPAPRPRSSPPPDGGPASGAELVRVRPGDTLWSLAAARLAPAAPDSAVDRLWRGWYAANRPVIGPDPDLLQPGQLLRPPDVPPSPRTAP